MFPGKACGIVLLEVLVACALAALVAGAALSLYGRGARAAAHSQKYAQAAQLGESLLAELGAYLEAAPEPREIRNTGRRGTLQWTTQLRQRIPEVHHGKVPQTMPALFELLVEIRWQSGTGKERRLRLQSQRLGQAPAGSS